MPNKKKKRKKRKNNALQQVKRERAARRTVEIENGIKKQAAGYHQTSKKDIEARQSNNIKEWD